MGLRVCFPTLDFELSSFIFYIYMLLTGWIVGVEFFNDILVPPNLLLEGAKL